MGKEDLNLKEIKDLANMFSLNEINACIDNQLQDGKNICFTGDSTDEIINVLSKAEFVKSQMEEGLSLGEAVRELAKRIRNVYLDK